LGARSDAVRGATVVSSAWAGWIEEEGSRYPLNNAPLQEITPHVFSGRWSPLRSFPTELDPLPAVSGLALSRAGWFRARSGTPCKGGLVVGTDGAFLAASVRFAAAVEERKPSSLSPSDFIHSFPSTAASLLTKLYGLADYQATVVEGRFSGVRALRHALDLLSAGRLTHVLVAVLSVSMDEESKVQIAAALCLESSEDGGGWEIEIRRERSVGELKRKGERESPSELLRRFGELSTIPLARLSTALDEGRTAIEIDCGVERDGARVYVSVRACDSQKG